MTNCINQFTEKIKKKGNLSIALNELNHPLNSISVRLSKEHKEWLLDPRTISCFKENAWTMEERCNAFRNRFPEAPRLAIKTLKHFYDHNKVPKSILYKDSKIHAKIVKPEPQPAEPVK